jgi:hypothetical protein
MKWMLVAVALALLWAGNAQAAGLQLPIEGATGVWIQPWDGTPGTLGGTISLIPPEKIVGETAAQLLRIEVVAHQEGAQVRIDPGVSATLKKDIGIPVKLGVVALPLTEYKAGWLIGAELYSSPPEVNALTGRAELPDRKFDVTAGPGAVMAVYTLRL